MWVKQIESELDDYEWLKETIHVLHVMIEALNMQPSRGPTITSSEQNEWQLLLRSLSDDEKTWDDLVNGEVVQTDMTSSEWHKRRRGMEWLGISILVTEILVKMKILLSFIHPCVIPNLYDFLLFCAVVVKVHRSSTWVKVQIRILKYYSSKSKSTAFSILLEWKYKSTQFFMYLSKKVLIDRFILQFYIDYFI